MAKTAKWSKLPSAQEIAAFGGMHCKALYLKAVASNWRCPGCGRTAQQLIRWSEIRGPSWRERFGDEYGMGWTISITRHHCHTERKVRFQDTIICGDCNSADGAVKRKLGLPASWSFSPAEIAQFVAVSPHSGKTLINYDIALAIYEDASRKA